MTIESLKIELTILRSSI